MHTLVDMLLRVFINEGALPQTFSQLQAKQLSKIILKTDQMFIYVRTFASDAMCINIYRGKVRVVRSR